MNDSQLLHDYVKTRSEEAFAALVRRHIDLVYAAARRQTADASAAEEITQTVFIVLARKAHTLHGARLAGWLLAATRYAACNARTAATRRRFHEQRAASMNALIAPVSTDDDPAVASMLDDALARLGEIDRSAVAMRYLQGKTLREIGDALGLSETAATKRVAR